MNKILIADEEKWFLEAVTDRIDAEYGMNHYDFVLNGSDALELLNKSNYKMIILDMMMPLGKDLELPENEPNLMFGIYILRLIRNINRSIPVVCYTILDDNVLKKQIKDLDAIHICKLDDNSFDNLFRNIKKYLNDGK
ncbi:response regulator [Flavobacterium sp.]|uniref:response regulator transcription factor n=1 Tax=Flavobacterium sp. TaxID=239 RepID=UPI0026024C01|nr:response regulator [Flavobacterium sp.]